MTASYHPQRFARRPLVGLAIGTLAAGLLTWLPAPAAGAAGAPPPSWSLGLRSTAYAYQLEDAAGNTDDRFQTYNVVSGSWSGLADGRLTFRGSGRFANDPPLAYPGFENQRLYSGHLEARLGERWRGRLGRQFITSGVSSATVDGAWLSYRPGGAVTASAWGGAAAPEDRGFDLGDLDKDAAAGGRLTWRAGRTLHLGLSAAYRERRGRVAARPVGLELRSTALRSTRLFARAAYDLEGDRWARLQAQARWRPGRSGTEVTAQYLDRYPSLDAASWFARFGDLARIRIARVSLRRELPSRFGGEVEYLGSFVDVRTSSRLGAALLVPGGRAGYSVRLGDAGEENRFFGELGGQVRPWLRLEGEATFLTYALLQDAPADDERDLTMFAARARVRLRQGLRLTAEVQSLDNPLFSEDVRVLVGVDLAMARGASRYGLDRGGWLR